jgi:FtsH-binding integral membrane protein
VARRVPINYCLLLAYTILESYVIGAIIRYYPVDVILTAMGSTLGMFIGLTLYALFTKRDLTYMGGMLSGGSMILLVAIIMTFFLDIPYLRMAIVVAILLLACLYVIYDTQLIAGKGKHKLSFDDYIIGALMLYADIMTIFTSLL